jgi:hypothetical protein
MHTSDWIALAACIAAFLALIPAFTPLLRKAKSKVKEQSKGTSSFVGTEEGATTPDPTPPLNNFGTAIVLTSIALTVGVVEIVLFSAIANYFGVAVDTNTMPLNWQAVYLALFLVPGLLLLRAIMSISNMLHL